MLRIDVWADLICPWCYLGKRRLEKALAGFEHRDEVEIVNHSFQLDPSFPRGTTQRTVDMLSAKFGMTVEQAKAGQVEMEERAAADGLEYNMTDIEVGNTFDAHRLVHFAASHDLAAVAVERLYRANFTENRSLFTHESLVELAVEIGLDGEETRTVLESDAYEADVAADGRRARELGATGVPFFVIDDRYGLSGAQPVELFSQALTRAWEESPPAV